MLASALTGRLLLHFDPRAFPAAPRAGQDASHFIAGLLADAGVRLTGSTLTAPEPSEPSRPFLASVRGQASLTATTGGLLVATVGRRLFDGGQPVTDYPAPLFLANSAISVLSGYPPLRRAVEALPRLGSLSGPVLVTVATLLVSAWRGSVSGMFLVFILSLASYAQTRLTAEATRRARQRAAQLRRLEGLPACQPEVSGGQSPSAEAREWLQLPSDFPELELYARRMTLGAFAAAALAYLLTRDPARSLAVLLIANPRAAYTSVTTLLSTALGLLVDRGVIVNRYEALPRLARVEEVWFDPAGTLTAVEPELVEAVSYTPELNEEQVIAYLYGVARGTGYPLEHALAPAVRREEVPRLVAQPWLEGGQGVKGTLEGDELFAGSLGFLRSKGVSLRSATAAIARHDLMRWETYGLAINRQLAGLVAIHRPVLSGASETLEEVRALGFPSVKVLRDGCPEHLPDELALETEAGISPNSKALVVVHRGGASRACREAFLSFATSDASCQAVESADLLATESWQASLPPLLEYGQLMRELTRQNLLLASGTGLVGLLLAIGGRISPGIALGLNEAVNLLVALNSNRLSQIASRRRSAPRPESSLQTLESSLECAAGREALAVWRTEGPDRWECPHGLTSAEARARLARYGPNRLTQEKSPGWGTLFLRQFNNSATLTLVGAGAVSSCLGHITDTLTIVAILLVNAVLGASQEYRAERSLAAIKELAAPQAAVVRDGVPEKVDAECLVPGDLILLSYGDRVPADAVIIYTEDLYVEESSLTGESEPVFKQAVPAGKLQPLLGEKSPSLESPYRVFMGTNVVRGNAAAVVTASGMKTQMGLVVSLIQQGGQDRCTIQSRYDRLTQLLVRGSLLAGGLVAGVGFLRGQGSILDLTMAGLSVAVAAIPEGLPAIVSMALASGVQRMAGKGALVRRLSAMETLGRVTAVCSDKTGTITESQLMVNQIWAGFRSFPLKSPGQLCNSEDALWTLTIGLACNHAQYGGDGQFSGDSVDVALWEAGKRVDLGPQEVESRFRRCFAIPFESERAYMATLCTGSDDSDYLFVKGAPETVLTFCDAYRVDGREIPLEEPTRLAILDECDALASQALRLVAAAYRRTQTVVPFPAEGASEQFEHGLVFAGLIALAAPARAGVEEAVVQCRSAGIHVAMITGDYPRTACAVARKVGILDDDGVVITGAEIEKMSDDSLRDLVGRVQVFARMKPAHKLRAVEAYRRANHTVIMTGDGVNDSPAVKWADVGFAMGNGTDVTKEASSVILVDNSFVTIVKALEEGEAIHRNIQAAFEFLLSGNFGEVLLMALAVIGGLPLPLLPLQMLLVNLFTDGLPALGLVLRDPAPRVSSRGRDEDTGLAKRVLSRGSLIGGTALGIYWFALRRGAGLPRARTLAFASIVGSQFLQFFHWPSLGFEKGGWLAEPKVRGTLGISWAGFLAALYVPALTQVFGFVPLSVMDWVTVFAPAAVGTGLVAYLDTTFERGMSHADIRAEQLPERLPERSRPDGRSAAGILIGDPEGA